MRQDYFTEPILKSSHLAIPKVLESRITTTIRNKQQVLILQANKTSLRPKDFETTYMISLMPAAQLERLKVVAISEIHESVLGLVSSIRKWRFRAPRFR